MIALFILPIYIIINIHLFNWFIFYLQNCFKFFENKKVKTTIKCLFLIALSIIYLSVIVPKGSMEHITKTFGNYHLGVLIYSLMMVFVLDIIRLISKKLKKEYSRKTIIISGTICIVFLSGLIIYGINNAKDIRLTEYEVSINKNVQNVSNMNITLVADLHLGYNIGEKQIEKMVDMINKKNTDIVIIAGDIFDNDYDAIKNPEKIIDLLKSIKSKYGVYAVNGNHDIQDKTLMGFTFANQEHIDNRMDEFLNKSNVKLLKDEYVIINGVCIYGRPDYKNHGEKERKTPQDIEKIIDKTMPIILIDHQPKELVELSNFADLDLSGHTHDGQFFPINFLYRFVWDNPCGLKKFNNMYSIVTSGVGLYGPNLRIGTHAEIVNISVNFN